MRKFLILLITVMFAMNLTQVTSAKETESDTFPQERAESVLEVLNLSKNESINSFDDINDPIVCFDVSDAHELLIVFDSEKIVVTDSDGNIINVLDFNCEGSYYAHWNNGNINLFLPRGDLVVEITPDGKPINITEDVTETDKTASFWSGFNIRRELTVGNKTYVAKKQLGILGFFTSGYTRLSVIDEAKNESVLLNSGLPKIIARVSCFCIFPIPVVFILKKEIKNKNKKRD